MYFLDKNFSLKFGNSIAEDDNAGLPRLWENNYVVCHIDYMNCIIPEDHLTDPKKLFDAYLFRLKRVRAEMKKIFGKKKASRRFYDLKKKYDDFEGMVYTTIATKGAVKVDYRTLEDAKETQRLQEEAATIEKELKDITSSVSPDEGDKGKSKSKKEKLLMLDYRDFNFKKQMKIAKKFIKRDFLYSFNFTDDGFQISAELEFHFSPVCAGGPSLFKVETIEAQEIRKLKKVIAKLIKRSLKN